MCYFVYYTHGDPLWQEEEGGHCSERRDGEIADPGEEQEGFKENTRMVDMKEWLIALGSHTSDADCQTGCKATANTPSIRVCCFSAGLRTHGLTVSPPAARSGSNILCSALKMSGTILTVSLVKCYCGFTFRTN